MGYYGNCTKALMTLEEIWNWTHVLCYQDSLQGPSATAKCNTGSLPSAQRVQFQALSQDCEKRPLTSSCLSLRPPVRMKKLGSQWTDFDETWYLIIFRKSVKKVQFSFKSYHNNEYFAWRRTYICDNVSLNSSENEKWLRQNLGVSFKYAVCPSVCLPA
jgi:hypothetical protein